MLLSWSWSASFGIGAPFRKYFPDSSIPSTTSPSSSPSGVRFWPWGMTALNPFAISGVTIMKMIRSTSITSIIGMTLGSDFTLVWPAILTDVATAAHRLLSLELLGKDGATKLGAHALDQVVDQLLGAVRHFGGQVLDLGGEVVVEPHRRDRDQEAERRGDQRLGDTAGDAGQAARRALRAHGLE